MSRLDTTLARDPRAGDPAAATTPATDVGTGTMVALLLGVLFLAMLALWAIAQTNTGTEGGVTFGVLDGLGDYVRRIAGTPHFCQVNTC